MAAEYFRSGADKVSIGSDAVLIVEERTENRAQATGRAPIETFRAGLRQPGRGHLHRPAPGVRGRTPGGAPAPVIETAVPGPNGERYCWYQCTIKGGREGRDMDAVTLAKVCEALGAGEILLNCIDRDGTNAGFDLELIRR